MRTPRRTITLVTAFAAGLLALDVGAASAQARDARNALAEVDTLPDPRTLPAEVAREVTSVFNAPSTLRATGPLEIEPDRDVDGDVAVLEGPLTVAGHVRGRIVAINADVVLKPGARVDGGILVVGGTVSGQQDATLGGGGDIRIYRQPLFVRREGDRIVAQRAVDEDERWWRRRQRWHRQSYGDLRLFSARTYNRIEGLPIYLGPSLVRRFDGGRLDLDVYGIFRTGENLEWQSDNLGHDVKAELRLGRRGGVAVGGRLYDAVAPVEPWQLTDTEVGLASFFLHRDFRDYWNRHGGSGHVALYIGRDVDVRASLGQERWAARQALDPFTLFRNGAGWRANPLLDEGSYHLANGTLRIDTRDSREHPWSGWYVVADYERGTGTTTLFGPTSPGVRAIAAGDGGLRASRPTTWQRGFLEVRRYNRIARDAQLNLRFVTGGWLAGDPLPLQRRLSLGGPGTLPGFDFRRPRGTNDPLTCSTGGIVPPGAPAQCDRMMLAQVEYSGDLPFGLLDGWSGSWHANGWGHGEARWILFADAGRGWLVGERSGELRYPSGAIPSPDSWRTDVGLGLTFNEVGLYVAKALSDTREPANFFVRVRRRF